MNSSESEQQDAFARITALENLMANQAREISELRQQVAGLSVAPPPKLKPSSGGPSSSASSRPNSARISTASKHTGGRTSVRSSNSSISTSTATSARGAHSSSSGAAASGKSSSKTSHLAGNKEPTYDAEEGVSRMYLKGRPITMYAPSAALPAAADGEGAPRIDVNAASQLPASKLQLEHVYGYRGRDCRSNLHALRSGEFVYFMAAVCVVQRLPEPAQRFYIEHNDDVKCLAVHPDGVIVASGQTAGKDRSKGRPHIRVWSSETLETLKVIGSGFLERAVACLAFSPPNAAGGAGGDVIAAIDDSNDHVISVWRWASAQKIAENKSSTEPVLDLRFHPDDERALVSCGKSHLAFWTLSGSSLSKKQAIYEKHEKPKFTLCMTYDDNGDLLTGDSSGNVYVWKKDSNKVSRALTGRHDCGIISICVTVNGLLITGGSKDRRIIGTSWDPPSAGAAAAAGGDSNGGGSGGGFEVELPATLGSARVFAQQRLLSNQLFIGTTRNCMLHAQLPPSSAAGGGVVAQLVVEPVAHGHTEELWGLAAHPEQPDVFLTAAYDHKVIAWRASQQRAFWTRELPFAAHSLAWHPEGRVFAVGGGQEGGHWALCAFEPISGEHGNEHELEGGAHSSPPPPLFQGQDGNEQIECVAFSPSGNMLALGSRTNHIYLYSVTPPASATLSDEWVVKKHGRCQGHSSFVLHVDWSADGRFLRSCSGDYELLYWSAESASQVTSGAAMRDVDWATETVLIGWPVAGIWPEGADGTDVNAVARSNSVAAAANQNGAAAGKEALLASADDFGQVNLYAYPAHQFRAKHAAYSGHSSHVTNVSFLADDSRVVTCGGLDFSVMQWRVIPPGGHADDGGATASNLL